MLWSLLEKPQEVVDHYKREGLLQLEKGISLEAGKMYFKPPGVAGWVYGGLILKITLDEWPGK